MKIKTFDCVQMKRKGAIMVQKQIRGKTLEQQIEFWKKGTEELKRLQKKLKSKS